jgi:hypothetical protein
VTALSVGASARARVGLALVTIVVACSGSGPPHSAAERAPCRPVEGKLAANTPWDGLAGSWRLTMVSATGSDAGHSVSGTMTLRIQDSTRRAIVRPGSTRVTVPLIGSADIALERVGAVRIGDIGSTESLKPGLAIWVSQSDSGVSAVLRIGQEEIPSDLIRFDGGFTALFLRQVSATSMRGGWASGVAPGQAGGYFCAERP